MKKPVIILLIAVFAAAAWWWSWRDRTPVVEGLPGQGAPLVLVQAAAPQPFADELEALGTTRAAESVDITARVTNVVTEIRFTEGERVAHGAPLAALESSEARADVAEAEAALVESRGQYQRARELLRTNAVSQSQVEQLEAQAKANEAALAAANARLQDHMVRAPFAGRVGLRRVSVGALVSPGTVITTLDDLSTVLLDFEVPETYLSGVAAGQTLTARSAAYPAREFRGVVETVDSRVDPATRAVTVRARLPNVDDLLLPGMFMTVRVLRERADLLLLPEQAVVPRQDRKFVFVVEDGVARQLEVETGRRTRGLVEVTAGLEPGQRVVIEGTQHVRDGAAVRAEPWRAAGR